MTFVLYQCAPIGVDRAPEAVAAYAFCSDDCRQRFNRTDAPAGTTWTQENPADLADFEVGHVCDTCGRAL